MPPFKSERFGERLGGIYRAARGIREDVGDLTLRDTALRGKVTLRHVSCALHEKLEVLRNAVLGARSSGHSSSVVGMRSIMLLTGKGVTSCEASSNMLISCA